MWRLEQRMRVLERIATLPQRYGPQETFLARLAAAGVLVRPLSDYAHARAEHDDEGGPEGDVRLVLGYAHLSTTRIRDGVRLMAEATRE